MPITFQGDGSAGNEQVDYDGTSIVVHIAPGHTTAENVVAAINAAGHDSGQLPFTAALDPLDNTGGGQGLVDVRHCPNPGRLGQGLRQDFRPASG